jgi:hypothetical protein
MSMKRSEWIEAVALMRLNWPHAKVEKPVAEKWFADLQHLSAEQVMVAIEALYRDGREFPPNAAQILGKIIDLSRDQIDHGEAWKLAKRAAIKADPKEAAAWLREQSPEAAEAVQRLCGSQLAYRHEDEPTVRAQFRDIFNNLVQAQRRDDAYAGLPSAGLRGLERGPRRLGDALKRALPAGETVL